MPIFFNGECLVVTTRGPGKLHLLSYKVNVANDAVVGYGTTSNEGVTRFLISFSHNYNAFAFMWDGQGEAVYGVGTGLQRLPIGRSWDQASALQWGAETVSTANVTSLVPGAIDRANVTTVFVIPDQI